MYKICIHLNRINSYRNTTSKYAKCGKSVYSREDKHRVIIFSIYCVRINACVRSYLRTMKTKPRKSLLLFRNVLAMSDVDVEL